MATTSMLYHTMGLKGYRLLRTEYVRGKTIFHIALRDEKRRCAHCGSKWVVKAGKFTRTFRSVPIGLRATLLVLHGHRHRCQRCGRIRREEVLFADARRRYSRSFARMVVELASYMALAHVAMTLRVGWDLVKEIFYGHLQRKLKKRRFSHLRYIAVDEFALRKGHRYITLVMDLETGAVLWVSMGKDSHGLEQFLWRLNRARAPLKAIAMDMSKAYYKAVRKVFPHLDVVYDPYHVVAMVNKAVDDVRKGLYRQLSGQERKLIKGSRYLLLKGLEKLKPTALQRLWELMEINKPLYVAYLLKEDFRRFWDFRDPSHAADFLIDWLDRAVESGLRPFIRLAYTLCKHFQGLMAYFHHRISTGPLEGLNNKIKVLKRQAYGYRDLNFFFLRIMFIHESIYSITG